MRRTTLLLAALLTTLSGAAVIGTAQPAQAEIYGVDDANDSPHGSDLFAVDIDNGAKRLVVKTMHDNLRRDPSSGSGGAVYIDTDRDDAGPEFVFVGGYFDGTDYQLLHTEGFGPSRWGRVAKGHWSMRVNYREDTVTMRMNKRALSGADDVRVAVRVSGTRRDGTSHGLVDWLGKPRQLTPWISEG
ncbi:MAG: hypothetical protein U0R78_18335 [Nocardioidaceae bacterium]